MIRRRGEGFTEHERLFLAEFLEDELIIQGFFQTAARRAVLARRSDIWTRIDDQSSTRVITRDWLPIVMPGSDPGHPRRKRSIILHDATTISRQAAGPETPIATETTTWYCSVGVKENRKTTTDVRPSLTTWSYVGSSALAVAPELGGDWAFSEPSEVWGLLRDDAQHFAESDRQARTLRELQRLSIFLTDQGLPH